MLNKSGYVNGSRDVIFFFSTYVQFLESEPFSISPHMSQPNGSPDALFEIESWTLVEF